MIEAIRTRGMGTAKRKREKVRGKRNFAGRKKNWGAGEKRNGTKVYVHARVTRDIGERERRKRYWREKQTYIAPCIVPTLTEEFGCRLRSTEENRNGRETQWASRTTAAKLMAPLVPHFSISLDYRVSLLSLLPLLSSRDSPRPGRPPGDIGTTTELPINNWLLNYYRTFQWLHRWPAL